LRIEEYCFKNFVIYEVSLIKLIGNIKKICFEHFIILSIYVLKFNTLLIIIIIQNQIVHKIIYPINEDDYNYNKIYC